MKHQLLLPLFICLMGVLFLKFSPTIIITGIVTDQAMQPISFATVMVKNASEVTTTDADGKFRLAIKDSSSTLVIKFLGYKTQEIKLRTDVFHYEIVMEEDVTALMDVVVTAQKIEAIRSSGMTYSVSELSGDEISDVERQGYMDPHPKAGVLTAGEINDFSKWVLWKDIESKDLKEYSALWKIHPDERYCVQVETENGMPVVDAPVTLVNNREEIFWSARTDNTGKAELWMNIFRDLSSDALTIKVSLNGTTYSLRHVKEFHNGINILKIPVSCDVPDAVDVAFVVDATGSMQDEIDYMKAELNNIIVRIKDSLSGKNLNLGCVFYRDHGDAYLTKKSDLNRDIQATVNFIGENNADGGGDFPEAVDEALNTAINHLSWKPAAAARMIFLILDAPPHDDTAVVVQLKRLMSQAAMKGIRIIPVTCSGIDKSTEYLLRSFALATNGTYVFLTDHSGIGYHHIEPTTDKYDVELLNNIFFRVIYNFSHTTECIPAVITQSSDTLIVLNPELSNQSSDSVMSQAKDSTHHGTGDQRHDGDTKFVRWKYYPNPTFGIVHIEVEGEVKEFFVTDLSGKILIRRTAGRDDSFEIDLSEFAAGTYLIAAEYSPDKRATGKVVVVH